MGHRKHSAPRRGSLAYRPRGRASSLIPRIGTWPTPPTEKPTLLGHAGFKAGCIHVVTVDDRERTPNYGKPLFNASTVLVTPPITVIGFRAYRRIQGALQALGEAYAKTLPRELERKVRIKPNDSGLRKIEKNLDKVVRFTAIACLKPRDAGLSQKKPFIFEIEVGGGSIKDQFEYLKSILGKGVKFSEIFKPGMYVDVAAVTKGKGFEGAVTRFGIKRKHHKSRKSIRVVAVLGPWHPAAVTYTVPMAGQHGFHKRTEYNKRVIAVGDASKEPITPPGGFPHYGIVRGEYAVVRGSVPGPAKRLIRLRYAIRPPTTKIQPPKILEVSVPAKLGGS